MKKKKKMKDEEFVYCAEKLTYVNNVQILVQLNEEWRKSKVKCQAKDKYLYILLENASVQTREIRVPIPYEALCHVEYRMGEDHLFVKIPLEGKTIHPLLTEKERNLKVATPSLERLKKDVLYCSKCGEKIVEGKKIEKIFPLPSKYWLEFSEMWVCCSNLHIPKNLPVDGKIKAKKGTLYDSTNYMLFNKEDICCDLKVQEVSGEIDEEYLPVCCPCGNFLGKVDFDSFDKLRNSSKSFESFKLNKYSLRSSTNLFSKFSFETHVSYELLSSAEAHDTFRFLVTCYESQKLYLLVNLINWDSCISTNEWHTTRYVPVLKLVFLDCTSQQHKEIASQWITQFKVETITLMESECKMFIDLLNTNNKLFPPSGRIFKTTNSSMTVSCMRMSL